MFVNSMQVLMKMPLRERPPVPAPQKSDAPGHKKNCTLTAPQLVPAVAEPVRVQPAKQKVYNMFTGEVRIQWAAALRENCIFSDLIAGR